ncbi:c-type cytochrome biogenesis protein CcmI [Mesorhizobium sp. NBSH29]|uniref:c-type cytochrome biogenesis protein CcmI n=1 Tax=Mesorhizobium sp. NBSH29 TaxID=2654249 RepID=UPI001896574C|nr:c-type cytochrome biogenesis protein CcmI [Mesorhizobium sp. NBSH29]QPC87227.1 c-type cytochrome biogenesis protein CcmI [Mesorhizobium sp. NBSH29]
MLFWFTAALLTFAASMAVFLPLVRGRGDAADASSHDLEVYRDQLAEVERDAARSVIGLAEATEARAEIGRRILRLDISGGAEPRQSNQPSKRAALAVLAVPFVAWGVYAWIGSPGLPGAPLAARMAEDPSKMSAEMLLARAEAHMAASPNDGKGWDVLAPIYARLGRAEEAVAAYRQAIALNGSSSGRESGLGEALARAGGGIISGESKAAFERALKLDPADPSARFFLANAMMQAGDPKAAAAALVALVESVPEGSPWRQAGRQALLSIERRKAASVPGPGAADIEAAKNLSEQDQAAMVAGMVENLDRKLRDQPRDPEGWRRLLQSYLVLQKPDAARDALARAVRAFGPDSVEATELKAYAAGLGITATEPQP